MNKTKNFVKTAVVYFVGNVLSKIISFFLLPLYTSYLEPAILGEYDYAVTIISFVAPICFFQVWDAMFRFSFDYEHEKNKTRIISNAYIVTVMGTILYIVGFGIINHIVNFKFFPLVFIYGMLTAISYLYTYLARVYRSNILFSVSGFINSLIVALCNIILILYFNMGLSSLYISAIIGAVFQCIIIEIYLRPLKKISVKEFDKNLIYSMIKFSLPLCVATVSYWLLSGFTKVIIVKYLSNVENGLYAVTNKFAMLLNMVVTVFQFAWNETAYISNKDNDRNLMYCVAIKYIFQFVIVASCGLMIVSKIMFPYLIGEAYQSAVVYIPASIISVAFNAIAGFLGTIFSTEKETKHIFWTTFIAAGMNCVLGVLFTRIFGLQGALIALGAAFGVLVILRLFILSKTLKIIINPKDSLVCIWLLLTILIFYLCSNLLINCIYVIILALFLLFKNRKIINQIVGLIKNGGKL